MRKLLKRPAGSFLAGVLVASLAAAGTATAAATITSKDIKNGTIQTKDLSGSAKRALKGNRGPAGPQGPAGPTGATGSPGASGADGSARAYGLVNNNSGAAVLQKAKGNPSVRRSGNGIFCVKVSGVDPNSTPAALTQDAAGQANGTNILLLTGNGPILSSQCSGDEFQFSVIDTNTGNGVNNVSFNFVIP